MPTANDVITGALKLLGIYDPGEGLESAALDDGVELLNDMLHSWVQDGVNLEWASVPNGAATLPVPDSHIRAIKYKLAIEFASHHGVPIPAQVAILADETYRRLQAIYAQVPDLGFDTALKRRPLTTWYGDR